MNNKLCSMLNTQVQKELESAYIYLYFASHFDSMGLTGFSRWFKLQAKEEEAHAMRIYDYLHECGSQLEFLSIMAPDIKIEGISQVLQKTLKHEEYITTLINSIYLEAEKEHDFATRNFLEWFIAEQREEENKVRTLIEKYNLYGSTGNGLYLLNKEMGKGCQ